MQAAREAYDRGDFAAAAEQFEKAHASAEDTPLDPSLPLYNKGNALYRLQRYDEAAEAFGRARRTERQSLHPDAYYNEGTSKALLAKQLEEQQQLQPALENIEEALALYRKALVLNHKDRDAKVNYELALRTRERLQKLQQQQQQNQQQDQQQDQNKKQDKGDNQQQQNQQQQSKQQKQDQQEKQDSSDRQKGQEQNESDQQRGSEGDQQEQERQPGQSRSTEEMTPEEAERLLNSMRQEEQTRREQLKLMFGEPVPVDKNW
jgi:Ca-activated chloride channel family protein